MLDSRNQQSQENLKRIIMLRSRVGKIELQIQEIEEKIDLLGSAVALLIKKADPGFGASDEL